MKGASKSHSRHRKVGLCRHLKVHIRLWNWILPLKFYVMDLFRVITWRWEHANLEPDIFFFYGTVKHFLFNRNTSIGLMESPIKQDRAALTFSFVLWVMFIVCHCLSWGEGHLPNLFIPPLYHQRRLVPISLQLILWTKEIRAVNNTRTRWSFFQHLCLSWFGHCHPIQFCLHDTGKTDVENLYSGIFKSSFKKQWE